MENRDNHTKSNPPQDPQRKPEVPDDFLFVFGLLFAIMGLLGCLVDLLNGEPLCYCVVLVFWWLSVPAAIICIAALIRSLQRHTTQWKVLRYIALAMLALVVVEVIIFLIPE